MFQKKTILFFLISVFFIFQFLLRWPSFVCNYSKTANHKTISTKHFNFKLDVESIFSHLNTFYCSPYLFAELYGKTVEN